MSQRMAGVARFAPFGDAAAVDAEVVKRIATIVRGLDIDRFAVAAPALDPPALLPPIDLIGHAHLGAGDDAEAVGVRIVRGAGDLRIGHCFGQHVKLRPLI